MPHPYDTAVIGAGVFGAWAAWHLRRAGQRVLLVDQHGPASARASSGGETRVIRMAYGPDEVYTRLSQASLLGWKALFAGLGQPDLFRETGVLWLAAAGDARAAQSLDVLARNHVRHEVLDAGDLASRYPQIAVAEGDRGLFEPDSGALLARRAVQALVAACVAAGVDLRIDTVLPVAGDARMDALRTASGEPVATWSWIIGFGLLLVACRVKGL